MSEHDQHEQSQQEIVCRLCSASVEHKLDQIHNDVKSIYSWIYTGNGMPAATVRLDRLEQSQEEKKYWDRTIKGAVFVQLIVVIVGAVAMFFASGCAVDRTVRVEIWQAWPPAHATAEAIEKTVWPAFGEREMLATLSMDADGLTSGTASNSITKTTIGNIGSGLIGAGTALSLQAIMGKP